MSLLLEAIQLRRWHRNDVKRLAELANNPRIAANMRDAFPHPYTLAHAAVFIERTINDAHFKHVHAIVFHNEVVGSIGLFQEQDIYRFNYELGYWLGEDYWGKGIMQHAVSLMLDYAKHHTYANRIYAGVFEYNKASASVLIKNNFSEVACLTQKVFKQGKFLNEYLFEILI